MRLVVWEWSLVLILLLTACAPPSPPPATFEQTTLRIVAADSCGPLMEELASAYQETHPWVTVTVQVYDAAVAEARWLAGAADLAALPGGRPDLSLPWSVPFARDTIVVIVHPDVPVEALTMYDLRELYRGRAGEWADGTPVQLVSREDGSGQRDVFEGVVMGSYDVSLTALVVPDSDSMVETVRAVPGGIGYVSLGRLEDGVYPVPIDGVPPTLDAVGRNPLTYPLFLTAAGEPTGELRSFAQWLLSPQGQQLVTRRYAPP